MLEIGSLIDGATTLLKRYFEDSVTVIARLSLIVSSFSTRHFVAKVVIRFMFATDLIFGLRVPNSVAIEFITSSVDLIELGYYLDLQLI